MTDMTLTPEQIAAGWKPHDGGGCPVPLDSRPAIMTRNGYWDFCGPSGYLPASAWVWEWSNSVDHIIAYREADNGR